MNRSIYKLVLAVLTTITVATTANAQSTTTSAISGVVTDSSGASVSGASVVAIHTPTGTTYRSVTRPTGAYSIVGMRPGGPYAVQITGEGFRATTVNDLFLQLSITKTLNIEVSLDVVELEAFVVSAQDISLTAPDQIGVATSLDAISVTSLPQTSGSLNDFARYNPFVTITEGDRNELTAAGQNNRFNSIQIDGVRVNDQFGLDSSGSVSFVTPVPFEAAEALNVEVSPYDLRQSGFTGASINVVTKSGSNETFGKLYTRYTDDRFRGESVRDGSNPVFREWTWGANLGGAIIQNKLFYFVSYEEFERTISAGNPGYVPDPGALQQLIDYGNNVLGVDLGSFSPPGGLVTNTETFLFNLDWNISDMHRTRVSYRSQDGSQPNLSDFDDFNETVLDTHFYVQERSEEYANIQFFSDWTSNLSTEFKIAYGQYRQPTVPGAILPDIEIEDFPRADGGFGELWFGGEEFRHRNILDWDVFSFTGSATYYLGNHEINFGFDFEETKFENTFLDSSFGNFNFDTIEDFLADNPSSPSFLAPIRRTGIEGQSPISSPEIGIFGLYLQNRWQVNEDLLLQFGVRLDKTLSGSLPPAAQGFESAFGFPNNGDIDGETLLAPRFGFKYTVNQDWIPEEHNVTIRGGFGLFQGRTPAVWFSNIFQNSGEITGTIDIETGLVDYLANDFDPNNPVIFIPREDSTPGIDALEEGTKLPSVWRGNLALDYEVTNWDLVFTVEGMITNDEHSLYYYDANQPVVGTLPDGRDLYQDRGVTRDFREVFTLANSEGAKSSNLVFSVSRPDRGQGFWGSLAVNFGDSEDVNPFTSSRAVSNWSNRAGFNFNKPEVGTSNFEVKERWLGVFGYTHDFNNGWVTRVSLTYEGRTGRPFSYIFDGDINGDTDQDNDLLYIPTGIDDPLVQFGPDFDTGPFFDFLERTGLDQHAGSYAPRNSHNNPWVHVWDLKVVQEIPLEFQDMRAEVFVAIRNFGNMLNDEWGLVEEVGFPFVSRTVGASIDGNQFVYESFDPEDPVARVGDTRSRWLMQFGASISF